MVVNWYVPGDAQAEPSVFVPENERIDEKKYFCCM